MIDLMYSLVIEATEPDYFGSSSPELEGFSGIGHSVQDCLHKAKWVQEELLATSTAGRFHFPDGAIDEMRLTTAVALKRRAIQQPCHEVDLYRNGLSPGDAPSNGGRSETRPLK